jgi:hypothetical protein
LARAALIDEHDVPVALDASKGGRRSGIHRRSRHSGTARQNEQRILGLATIDRRYPRDVQLDLAASGRGRILSHFQRAAFSNEHGEVGGVLELTG